LRSSISAWGSEVNLAWIEREEGQCALEWLEDDGPKCRFLPSPRDHRFAVAKKRRARLRSEDSSVAMAEGDDRTHGHMWRTWTSCTG